MPRLRLATFNLESLGALDSPRLDPARVAALRPALLRLGADVLCLQEVNAQHPSPGIPRALLALDALLDGTPYAGYARAISTRPGGEAPADLHNLVVLSRFPIVAQTQHQHALVDPPLFRPRAATPQAERPEPIHFDRPILHATIEVGARRLDVFNLHLRAPRAAPIAGQKLDGLRWRTCEGWAEGAFVAAVKRAAQALEARLLVDRLFAADPQAAIAVCGDFNCDTREMPTRIIAAAPDETNNPALASRALRPVGLALPPAQRHSVIHAGERVMLDHLLVSQALADRFTAAQTFTDGLVDEALVEGSVDGSTHAPFVAEFDLET